MTEEKIVVITGASGGLGHVLCKEFNQQGWRVIGMGRSPQPKTLEEAVEYHQFDASSDSACRVFWGQLKQKHPGAQLCLVNNAGGYVNGSLAQTTAKDYEQQIKSSYFSSVHMTREMTLAYSKARIINIVSATALHPRKNNSAYGAAKAAQMHFFQSLQDELDIDRYVITNLYPLNIASGGPTENAMTAKDLAMFVREQASNDKTYYLRDATLYPLN